MTPRLLRLPASGRLLVATDIQGNLRDFLRMLELFEASPERSVLVFTGDLVHGPDEHTEQDWPDFLGTPYRDESPEVVRAFLEAEARYPGRVYCLMGNHEHAHVGGPRTAKFHDDEAQVLEERMGPGPTGAMRTLFARMPLVAVAPNGVVLLHAAPAAHLERIEDLENVQLDGYTQSGIDDFFHASVLGPILWSRMARPEQARAFLSVFGGRIAIYGHDVVREGYERVGAEQLCVSTSFALFDQDKTYVELDLARVYPDVQSLREGVELKKLYT
ncbi:metallophosphoesterase family protein [Hyalangium rubrum]|uniref:Metallophosphoesterase family protein n=1 Tax=Hyalangium rubrum TaxID=3103134 RepID=A0ABU5HC99_9BACT|nr:metallophosphoesterase family protein [Hyalangium sp. s54d21]MDY7231079.1 metallophosphoesterase family protein [Hyalangium sp. s54d21]